jgi:hypothetical protein
MPDTDENAPAQSATGVDSGSLDQIGLEIEI